MKILDLGTDSENKVKLEEIKISLGKNFPKAKIIIPDGSHEIISLGLDGCDINIRLDPNIIPLKDNSIDLIWSRGFFEHIENVYKVMEDCWRILKPNGILIINTPHFSSAGAHYVFDHKSFWGYSSLIPWLAGEYRFEPTFLAKMKFKRLGTKLFFLKPYRYLGLSWLFNRFPIFYEKFLCWIFPALEINFLFQKQERER